MSTRNSSALNQKTGFHDDRIWAELVISNINIFPIAD